EALKDADKKDDFREQNEGNNGGGGGGGGQPEPLVPPIAQLRLLRGMQAEAAERTRSADDSRDAGEVDALSTLQRELADMGKALIEKMNNAPGAPKIDPNADKEPGKPDADKPDADKPDTDKEDEQPPKPADASKDRPAPGEKAPDKTPEK